MSISNKIIKEIDMLSEDGHKKVLNKIKEKYMAEDVKLVPDTQTIQNYSCTRHDPNVRLYLPWD